MARDPYFLTRLPYTLFPLDSFLHLRQLLLRHSNLVRYYVGALPLCIRSFPLPLQLLL